MNAIPLSLYIHIPWCVQKCPYCDFNSHELKSHELKGAPDESQYIDRLLMDLASDVSRFTERRPLQSIFIGGGTPSLFSGASIARLLDGVAQQLSINKNTEITLEANPGTVDAAHFAAYRQAGVNRLSIGVQSFNNRQLLALGRIHHRDEAIRAVEIAKATGFDNINIDVMFGLPLQTAAQMLADIEQGIAAETEHLSYYQLTIEPNTAFAHRPPRLPEEDQIIDTFELASERLVEAGFRRYEVSAWTKGRTSAHNVNYWEYGDYLGIGAGAHGKITTGGEGIDGRQTIIRTLKPKHPKQYLAADNLRQETPVPTAEKGFEFMLNALRLCGGFNQSLITSRGLVSLDTLTPVLMKLVDTGLLTWEGQWIAPTAQGQRFLNDCVAAFLPTTA
ncbi:radical SAM family heme chaperone HemW [Ostreibacterium oceani]|uniref:Heme chaperone HemW n=1 Tax=Ostreibacterium oceani TaxID=2654998 RepID=A0A6N7EVV0_9GAMM|nr:radical SAM family heme chaperone HemW [Ostreibacterium oceani]MPV85680.1 radical SAM family heme chaperone HemW [Ostreibacterium oceani]